jgi:FAD/FMN-containing dehydrogenase
MNQALRKLSAAAQVSEPVTVEPTSPNEIAQILKDLRRYPSPVRPIGSGSSPTRCTAANGGTTLDLGAMNRVLRIDRDSVTVQPGVLLPDLADALSQEGLELIGGFDLANRSVGGAVCAAALEASALSNGGQFARQVLSLKVMSPRGKRFEVSEKSQNLLSLLRLSYGLLGVVYEITLRVRPIQGFAVQTATLGFGDLAKLVPRLVAVGAGLKLYLLPFRDRIYIELRKAVPEGGPGTKAAWRFKDWACYSALPDAIRSLNRVVPIRQLRYPLIDSLSSAAHALINNALFHSGSNSVEQSGRFRGLGARRHFNYCSWAFPVANFGAIALAYRDFSHEHYARNGFRCDMPTIAFRLHQDRSALLSPTFDGPVFTLSPISTQNDGWDAFVFEFAEFAAEHAGIPIFNQTRNATAEIVGQRYGSRLAFFRRVRNELDPENRLLNPYFATYMS